MKNLKYGIGVDVASPKIDVRISIIDYFSDTPTPISGYIPTPLGVIISEHTPTLISEYTPTPRFGVRI